MCLSRSLVSADHKRGHRYSRNVSYFYRVKTRQHEVQVPQCITFYASTCVIKRSSTLLGKRLLMALSIIIAVSCILLLWRVVRLALFSKFSYKSVLRLNAIILRALSPVVIFNLMFVWSSAYICHTVLQYVKWGKIATIHNYCNLAWVGIYPCQITCQQDMPTGLDAFAFYIFKPKWPDIYQEWCQYI